MKKIISVFKQEVTSKGLIIEGWANKAVVDDVNDLMNFKNVDMGRFKKNPILLYNHNHDLAIGKVLEVKITEEGMWIKAQISNSKDATISYIRDLIAEGILKTLSIGFTPKQENFNRNEGFNEIVEWRLNEISVVTLPANIEAEFALVKSLSEAKNYEEAKQLVMKAMEGNMPTKEVDPKVEDPKPEPQADAPKVEGDNSTEEDPEKGFKECVNSKIPKLVEEGRTPEEAVAIAMSMCREEGKCDISIMSTAMFAFANEVALACKPQDPKEGKKDDEKAVPENIPPPAAPPASAPITTTADPMDYGNPHLELMKSQLAMIGKISTQLELISQLLEKGENVGDNETVNPEPEVHGVPSAKELMHIAEISKRIDAMAKSVGV
jgi:HK97 family phage prohead protease